MKITIAQLNPVVGDIGGNLGRIHDALDASKPDKPDLLVLTELFLTGYPPRDLLNRGWFIDKVLSAVEDLVEQSKQHPETGILVGAPLPTKGKKGIGLHNSAILIHNGRIVFQQNKVLLPTYDVFDEARYFDAASSVGTVEFKGEVLGISICEDAWTDPELRPHREYHADPIEELSKQGATLLINISASPFSVGKDTIRHKIVSNRSKKHGVPFVLANQIGANDELIFDGRSMCTDRLGNLIGICPSFEEHIETFDTATPGGLAFEPEDEIVSVHKGLVLGVRDYLRKCGFSKAVVGLSGGIDSAVTCALAAEAIGPENVLGVTMPSMFSSPESGKLASELAENLGIDFKEIPIASTYEAYVDILGEHLKRGDEISVTLENIQARIRGNILMALSNEYGYLVLSTGNKSELAVGYCTLYGDMSGGLAVLSDVPKTMVFKLARYVNRNGESIPVKTITRAPSAELKHNQTDQDTLPPYDVLDDILRFYIDDGESKEEIAERGFDLGTVDWVVQRVIRNEYKRRQAAPGLRVTSKAFGMGWRMPIAAEYED